MTRHERVSGLTPLMMSLGLRPGGFRGAVLAIVWALSGTWPVGHAIAHATEPESGHHVEGQVVPAVAAHGHGHSHPEPLPVVFHQSKAPKFGAPAVLAVVTPEIRCTNTLIRWCARIAPARASPSVAVASGPRAPPLS
jgi:hypothetical protein